MTKERYMKELEKKFSGLPNKEKEEWLSFYEESIDDRLEEGKSMDEIIIEIGEPDDVLKDVLKEIPLGNLVKERIKPKRKKSALEILFLILGFPLWFPLFITFLVLVLVGYILIWVGVIVGISVFISMISAAIWGIFMMIAGASQGDFQILWIGIILAGFGGSVLTYHLLVLVTKATLKLTKNILLKVKGCFVKGGRE